VSASRLVQSYHKLADGNLVDIHAGDRRSTATRRGCHHTSVRRPAETPVAGVGAGRSRET